MPDRLRRTIEELEGEVWGDPPAGATSLVRRCHALRRVALGDLSASDLRVLVGQQIGLPWVVPLALDVVGEVGPAVAASYYGGDLFGALGRLPAAFWDRHREWRVQLEALGGGDGI